MTFFIQHQLQPFHSGFEDQTGVDDGVGTTLHIPLLPGATYNDSYKAGLEKALQKIIDFQTEALVVSLGLDTLKGDPCAIRRAGFLLEGDDYKEIGTLIRSKLPTMPILVVQEGGYKMNDVPSAAADVLMGISNCL
jgi:acetoin utilization deacetylase AcuC-like enzyme